MLFLDALPQLGAHTIDRGILRALRGRARSWARQAICAVHGHDFVLHCERSRLSLRCASCGHDTRGWEIGNRGRCIEAVSQPLVERVRHLRGRGSCRCNCRLFVSRIVDRGPRWKRRAAPGPAAGQSRPCSSRLRSGWAHGMPPGSASETPSLACSIAPRCVQPARAGSDRPAPTTQAATTIASIPAADP